MNLTEGQWAHITVGSAEDARIAFAHFQYGQREAVDSLIKAMRNHPNLQSLCGLTIDPLNVDPSATFSSSSSSSSLAYSHYPSTSLCMADEGIDDLMAVLLGNDLLFNHTITSINLENNYIMQVGRLALIKAIFSNVTLKSIYYQKQRDPVPLSDIYNDSRRSNILFNAEIDSLLEDAKLKSFIYRINIAIFVRGTFLCSGSLQNILEFLIGPGPQVARFMQYRRSYLSS